MPFKSLEQRREYNKTYYAKLKKLREQEHKKAIKEAKLNPTSEKPNQELPNNNNNNDNFFLNTLKTQSKNMLLKAGIAFGALVLKASYNAIKKTMKYRQSLKNTENQPEISANPLD